MSLEEQNFDTNLKDLTAKRSSFKGRLTKFKNHLEILSNCKSISPVEISKLSIKLSRFETLFTDFDELQTQIEVLNEENQDAELNIRDSIEQDFCYCIATAQQMIDTNSSPRKQSSSCDHDHNDCENIMGFKLPTIKISNFDGSYYKWLEFKDTFVSLVHNNTKIKDIHKFYYLNSYLEGEAARVVSNLEVSDRNYSKAWELLCERYDNKRQLINNHLKALLSVETVRETEKSFRFIIDHVTKNLRALHTLGLPTESWDMLIIFLISQKLDTTTSLKWEESRSSLKEIPTLDDFLKFLKDRADVFETIKNKRRSSNDPVSPRGKKEYTKSFSATTSPSSSKVNLTCPVCKGRHRIYECSTFKGKSIAERSALVSSLGLCANCLRRDHSAAQCRLPGGCKVCKQRHNSLIHSNISEGEQETVTLEAVALSSLSVVEVLLCTALVDVYNPSTNAKMTVRTLLDSGSQSSFLTSTVKHKLGLPSQETDTKIIGIGDTKLNILTERSLVRIQSQHSSYSNTISCLILPKLTGQLPKVAFDARRLNISKFQLADPSFNIPSDIDMILGAELFWCIIGTEQHSLGEHNPILRSSKLGWLIAGPIGPVKRDHKIKSTQEVSCNLVSCELDLCNEITKFWDLEKVPNKTSYTDEERLCEQHFLQNTYRCDDGRFCVRIPLRCDKDCLGNSYALAKRRFFSLERRLNIQPLLKELYVDFIKEYADLKHLSVYDETPSESAYYLPHHPVLKLTSESTKVRVVYDASARTTSGFSVNDLQMVGPNIQDSLFNILVRFRQHNFVVSADIEKMYRSVLVDESDRDLQLILWREQESQPLMTLQLNTVTYGFSSSSFLSTRCLFQCGEECGDAEVKTIIQNDFYIDDLLTGACTEDELCRVQRAVSDALSAGGFHLRKYRSNSKMLESNIQEASTSKEQVNAGGTLTISNATSTLGIGWTSTSDELSFPVKTSRTDVVTKRAILSATFKVFDPLGLLSLCTVKPKIMIQKLWSESKLGWDDEVPPHIESDWLKFIIDLEDISSLRIPRHVLINDPVRIEMHCFCDASEQAYGACIYLKSHNNEDEIQVHLLCAKSRVCPIKRQTIPRLELCGALLSAQLADSVTQALRCRIDRHVYWTDSKVVLGWLQTAKTTKTFVANRVAAIKEISDPSSWRYVPTSQNPADLVSRGVQPSCVALCKLWWHGPTYLLEPEVSWPTQEHNIKNLPEIKTLAVEVQEPFFDLTKISRFSFLQRTYAWVLRFINNVRTPQNKLTGPLQATELKNSMNVLVKISQKESFENELKLLSNNKQLKASSILASLNIFIDQQGMLRVGGRLSMSDFDYDKKYPILLHAKSHLTKILFQNEHVRLMHAGPSHLLASIRNNFWPIGGRDLARRTTRNCLTCRRFKGESMTNIMGNLPRERLANDFPFNIVGTDFAGPFMITDRKGRGAKITKCYLCLFICFTYKCIHLEAVSELSSNAYLLALRRLISRRGIPAQIWSDNGRNYVGTAREITDLLKSKEYQDSVLNFASNQNIEFKFSPVYAPNFGGYWESGIKSAKFHLKRVMGITHLTFEELSSLFAQVEAILNSRPLCPLSPSPDDFQCLTPGHFLIGRPLTSLPSPSLLEVSLNRLDRFQRLEQVRQHFWKRWANEYVAELQQRTKWRTRSASLKIHDLVLLKEPNAPPLCWRLGRVTQLHPGADGVPRVADIITAQGIVRRALNRICLLPTAS